MSELKVGTKVRIKSDLECDEYYGKEIFVEGMDAFLGIETEISEEIYSYLFELECDEGKWYWSHEMFDVVE